MKYLLDTNILSEALRPVPNRKTLKGLRDHQAEVATAAPIWHEMWFGCCRLPPSAKREAIEEYLRAVIWPTIPILFYDADAAEWHARERARLTAAGKTPAFVDGQIAAIAMVNNLILVTHNIKDYRIFKDLHVENWQ